MSQPIEFFFDFSSPYAYLAAQRIDGIAARHDRAVLWRPILLGAIFKEPGGRPLKELGQKWIYAKHELARTARLHGVPFVLPEPFPFAAVTASRAFYAIAEDDPARARDFAKAVFRGTFASALDMGQASHVASVAQSVGVDAPA